jgi:initiation factor 1A
MVRNMTGGKGHKKGKRSNGDKKRIIEYADEINSLYALVMSPLGDCKFLVHCNDNNDRIGVIRGSLYKNTFITPGDVVLVSLRDFEKSKPGCKERCDIVIKYMSGEIDQLKKKQVFYLNSNNLFNLTLDKGKGKTTKDIDNDTEGISFNSFNNVGKQATLKELPDIVDAGEEELEEEVEQEREPDISNDVSESSDVDAEDVDDEYGNNIKYAEKERSSKSFDDDNEEESSDEDEKEKQEPIPQFKNRRGVYTNDDDFM